MSWSSFSLSNWYNKKAVVQPSYHDKIFTHPLNQKQRSVLFQYSNKTNIFAKTLLNSNDSVQKQQDHFRQQIQKIPLFTGISQEYGLPNVGNTCFINSFMQFIFSSKKFRLMALVYPVTFQQQSKKSKIQSLNESSLGIKDKNAISIIQELFWTMITPWQKDYEIKLKKRNIMEKVVSLFETQQKQQGQNRYTRYSQQDSFSYLLNIISILKKEDQKLTDIFKFSYMKICFNQNQHKKKFTEGKNGQKQLIIQRFQGQYILQFPYDNCGEDQCIKDEKLSENQFVFLDESPDVLLMTKSQFSDSAQYQNQLWYFQLSGTNISQEPIKKQTLRLIHYQQKAKLMYSGDGISGHCIASRKTIQQNILDESRSLYIFNDSQIFRGQTQYYRRFRDTAYLYEKTNVIQLDCQEITNKFKLELHNIELSKAKSSYSIKNNRRYGIQCQPFLLQDFLKKTFKSALSENNFILKKLISHKEINILPSKLYHIILWMLDQQKLKVASQRNQLILPQKENKSITKDNQDSEQLVQNHTARIRQNNLFKNPLHPQQKVNTTWTALTSPPENKQPQVKGKDLNNFDKVESKQSKYSTFCCSLVPVVGGFECQSKPSLKKHQPYSSDPPVVSILSDHRFSSNPQYSQLTPKIKSRSKDLFLKGQRKNLKPDQKVLFSQFKPQTDKLCESCNQNIQKRPLSQELLEENSKSTQTQTFNQALNQKGFFANCMNCFFGCIFESSENKNNKKVKKINKLQQEVHKKGKEQYNPCQKIFPNTEAMVREEQKLGIIRSSSTKVSETIVEGNNNQQKIQGKQQKTQQIRGDQIVLVKMNLSQDKGQRSKGQKRENLFY